MEYARAGGYRIGCARICLDLVEGGLLPQPWTPFAMAGASQHAHKGEQIALLFRVQSGAKNQVKELDRVL